MATKTMGSYRLSSDTKSLIKQIADKYGISEAAVIQMAVVKLAEAEGVKTTATDH